MPSHVQYRHASCTIQFGYFSYSCDAALDVIDISPMQIAVVDHKAAKPGYALND